METINLITGALANLSNSQPDEAVSRLLENALRGLDASAGCVFLSAGSGRSLRLIHSRGVNDPAAVRSAVSDQFVERVAVQAGNVGSERIDNYPALATLRETGGRAFSAGLFGRARGWRGLLLLTWPRAEDAEDALPALKQICSFAGQALAEYEMKERRTQDFIALSAQLQQQEADYQRAATCAHDAAHPLQNVIRVVFAATGDNGSASLSPEAIKEVEDSVSLAGNILKGTTAIENRFEGEVLRVGQILEMAPSVISGLNTGKSAGNALRFEMDAPNSLPVIFGNRVSLVRVLNNLLSNAAKYNIPNGFVQLTVRQNNNRVVFDVANSGPAIGARDLGRLFDFGYRVEEHTQQVEGHGIGLYSCKQIIQRHGGQIWATSAEGLNHFAFSIPVAKTAPQ
ncbi:MAG: sensor histidine kinase [Chloroflexi bacterium]|nr:sensor histidine kinase [Chloroflexota bacterium]